MPPRDPQPAISRRKSKLKLDVQEPALTKMLEKYCDLRRRGFDPGKPSKPRPAGPGITRNYYWKKPKGAQCLAPRKARNRPCQNGCSPFSTPAPNSRSSKGRRPYPEPADQEAAGSRPQRRQRASPDRPHHQKPGRHARQGLLAGRKRNPHAPAVRRRLPGQLPRQNWPFGSAPRSLRG